MISVFVLRLLKAANETLLNMSATGHQAVGLLLSIMGVRSGHQVETTGRVVDLVQLLRCSDAHRYVD